MPTPPPAQPTPAIAAASQPQVPPTDQALLLERSLRWTELFSQWPQPRIAALMRSARLLRHARGALLTPDAPQRRELYVVVSGMVEISSISEDGRKYMHSFIAPGHVAPLVRLLDATHSTYQYRAHVASQVIHLPTEAVVAELDAEPLLWKAVARLALRRQSTSTRNLSERMLGSLPQRLAAALTDFAQLTDQALQSGHNLPMALSQAELAAMLGVTRQTLNKTLRRLSAEGVLEAVYKRITVLDAAALRRIARGGEPQAQAVTKAAASQAAPLAGTKKDSAASPATRSVIGLETSPEISPRRPSRPGPPARG